MIFLKFCINPYYSICVTEAIISLWFFKASFKWPLHFEEPGFIAKTRDHDSKYNLLINYTGKMRKNSAE